MKPLLLAVFIAFSLPVMSKTTWQLAKEDNNIAVYTRSEPGSLYKSFKAVSVVFSSPQEIFEVLDDVTAYKNWFAFTQSVRLVEHSQDIKYVYMETAFPWPFSNEDMVYQITSTKRNDGAITLILEGDPDFIPAIDGISRMHAANGYISLRPEKDQTTITYVMHSELGGGIPPSLANRFIHKLPFQTLENLIRIVKQDTKT